MATPTALSQSPRHHQVRHSSSLRCLESISSPISALPCRLYGSNAHFALDSWTCIHTHTTDGSMPFQCLPCIACLVLACQARPPRAIPASLGGQPDQSLPPWYLALIDMLSDLLSLCCRASFFFSSTSFACAAVSLLLRKGKCTGLTVQV